MRKWGRVRMQTLSKTETQSIDQYQYRDRVIQRTFLHTFILPSFWLAQAGRTIAMYSNVYLIQQGIL